MGLGKIVGGIPIVGGAAKGLYDAGTNAFSDIGDFAEGAIEDYSNIGKNRFTEPGWEETPYYWGGNADAARNYSQFGLNQIGQGRAGNQFSLEEMAGTRGPMAQENQILSDRESMSRYGDQGSALEQARQGAMYGSTIAQAIERQGQNAANDMQTAMAAGARGNAALAQAQNQAAANQSRMAVENTLNAAQTGAQYQQQAMQHYGNMANQQRAQDQNRLQMGNQMSQFNAGLNDQYRLGMGNLAQGFQNSGANWYQSAATPYTQQAQINNNVSARSLDAYNQRMNRAAGVSQANADAKAGQTNAAIGTITGAAGQTLNGIGNTIR